MTYGLAIPTTIGVTTLENVRSLQEVYRARKTSASGSQAIPNGATSSNAAVFFEVFDGGCPPSVSWSGSTLVWSSAPAALSPSSNFDLIVCRFK